MTMSLFVASEFPLTLQSELKEELDKFISHANPYFRNNFIYIYKTQFANCKSYAYLIFFH